MSDGRSGGSDKGNDRWNGKWSGGGNDNEEKMATSKDSTKHPSVQDIFDVLKLHPSYAPEVSEDELKKGDTSRPQKAIFVPSSIQKAFDGLPDADKKRLQWYGEQYYSQFLDDKTHDSLEKNAYDSLMAVKSGLSPKDLSDDEKMVLRKVYGKEWYLLAHLTSENDEDTTTAVCVTTSVDSIAPATKE